MNKKMFKLIICFFVILKMNGQDELPIAVSDDKIVPLKSLVDADLQKNLEKELMANPHWKKLIAQKKMAVGLVDLRNPDAVKFARINGNHMMYAASLPKIAILLAAIDAIEKGKATVDYGMFTTNVSVDQLELVEANKTKKGKKA